MVVPGGGVGAEWERPMLKGSEEVETLWETQRQRHGDGGYRGHSAGRGQECQIAQAGLEG